jgi:hypothetical protein
MFLILCSSKGYTPSRTSSISAARVGISPMAEPALQASLLPYHLGRAPWLSLTGTRLMAHRKISMGVWRCLRNVICVGMHSMVGELRDGFSPGMRDFSPGSNRGPGMLIRPRVTDKRRRLIRQSTSTGLATPRPPRLSTWMEAVYSGEAHEDHASKPGSDALKDRSVVSDKLVSSRRRPMSRRGIEVPAGTCSRRDDRSIVGSWISIGGLGARGGRDRARSCRLGGSRFPGEWGADGSTQARFLIGQGSLVSSDPDRTLERRSAGSTYRSAGSWSPDSLLKDRGSALDRLAPVRRIDLSARPEEVSTPRPLVSARAIGLPIRGIDRPA